MKRALSRPFDCTIAGKVVTIAARSGQNLMERGKPYVSCSERDCQYVGENTAPCPLRLDMFDDGVPHHAVILRHLARAPRRPVCFACITEKLGVTHERVRQAAWRLHSDHGAHIRPARCTECGGRRVTITIPVPPGETAALATERTIAGVAEEGEAAPRAAHARVVGALSRAGGDRLCAACLAFTSSLPLADVRRIVLDLQTEHVVSMTRGTCEVCGRVEAVVGKAT